MPASARACVCGVCVGWPILHLLTVVLRAESPHIPPPVCTLCAVRCRCAGGDVLPWRTAAHRVLPAAREAVLGPRRRRPQHRPRGARGRVHAPFIIPCSARTLRVHGLVYSPLQLHPLRFLHPLSRIHSRPAARSYRALRYGRTTFPPGSPALVSTHPRSPSCARFLECAACCPAALLPCCPAALLPCCPAALLPCCPAALLPLALLCVPSVSPALCRLRHMFRPCIPPRAG